MTTRVSDWLNDTSVSRGSIVVSNGVKIPITKKNYPADEAAERALLGALLLIGASPTGDTTTALSQVSMLAHTDFFYMRNGIIYRAMQAINGDGMHVDVQSLKTRLREAKMGSLNVLAVIGGGVEADGERYLYALMEATDGIQVRTYANQLLRISLQRQHIFMTEHLLSLHESGKPLDLILAESSALVTEMNRRFHAMSGQTSFQLEDEIGRRVEMVKKEIDNPEFVPGITSGIESLDRALLYFQRGRGYVFAAPSGWGKTIALMNFAINAASAGYRVLYITMEMSKDEFIDRCICAIAQIDYGNYQLRQLTDEEYARLSAAETMVLTMMGAKKFIIEQLTYPTLDLIEVKMRDHYIDPGFDLVLVDYLKADMVDTGKEERLATIEIFTRWERWKKELFSNAAHVTATQINRAGGSDERADYNRDRLYGSTIIANKADAIIFLYREDLVLGPEYLDENVYMEFLIDKGRNTIAGVGNVKAIMIGNTLRLGNVEESSGMP